MTEEEIQKIVTDVLVSDFECERAPSISSCGSSR